jgi:hypothetical protein
MKLTEQQKAARYDDGVPHHQPGIHDELHNIDVAHEHIDVDLRALGVSIAVMLVVVVLSMGMMYGLFWWFDEEAKKNDPNLGPLAVSATEMPKTTTGSPYFSVGAAGPQLLTNEPVALAKQRDEEQKRLNGYGWLNEASGIAHLPIADAKKLIVTRGLPSREGAGPAHFTIVAPARGESSGGRTITVAPAEPSEAAPAPPKPHGGH